MSDTIRFLDTVLVTSMKTVGKMTHFIRSSRDTLSKDLEQ